MLRKFIATALLVVSLHAQTEKFQVIANNVNTKENILIATGNVVIFFAYILYHCTKNHL